MATKVDEKTTVKNVDWNTYLFHCSSLPALMTNARAKGEMLSETAKSRLREIWIEETFGRKKFDTSNKYTEKGLLVEQDSLDLISRVHKTGFLTKCKEELSNDFIIGTPDVIKPRLRDAKSSWDIWTFNAVDEKKARSDYFWQMFGYMWLTGQESAMLDYSLVNTPVEIKESELYKLTFKNLTPEEVVLAEKNFNYDDIPEEIRVKSYEFFLSEASIDEVKAKLIAARMYLKGLSL